MKISPSQNYRWTWCLHIVVDPFVVMVCLGALGHTGNWPFLYHLSYFQVWLATMAIQFFWPVISDPKIIPSKEKVKL